MEEINLRKKQLKEEMAIAEAQLRYNVSNTKPMDYLKVKMPNFFQKIIDNPSTSIRTADHVARVVFSPTNILRELFKYLALGDKLIHIMKDDDTESAKDLSA